MYVSVCVEALSSWRMRPTPRLLVCHLQGGSARLTVTATKTLSDRVFHQSHQLECLPRLVVHSLERFCCGLKPLSCFNGSLNVQRLGARLNRVMGGGGLQNFPPPRGRGSHGGWTDFNRAPEQRETTIDKAMFRCVM